MPRLAAAIAIGLVGVMLAYRGSIVLVGFLGNSAGILVGY